MESPEWGLCKGRRGRGATDWRGGVRQKDIQKILDTTDMELDQNAKRISVFI